jgi:hypothetical protein
MEQALVDLGIQPMVVSSGDSARGALPLAHSRCTVIKVNGDYLDARLKNTAGELASYEFEMERLLDQVFDEYGLIVCGWSADWDIALRATIERCPTRRFTTYWAAHGKRSAAAQRLTDHRSASVLEIADADTLFRELLDGVSALEQLTLIDPVPAKVAVARMKRYLVDDVHRISLSDLLKAETERVYATLKAAPFTTKNDPRNQPTEDDVRARLRAYEGAVKTLLNLMICGAAWGTPNQNSLWTRSFQRAADWGDVRSGQLVLWNDLRRYPALLLLYGVALAAISSGNYSLLRSILYGSIRDNSYEPEQPVAKILHNRAVMERKHQQWCFAGNPTGLSDYVFTALRDPLREYLPDDIAYERAFDWFEYLLCLVHCDVQTTRADIQRRKEEEPGFILKAPFGRFVYKVGTSDDIILQTAIREEQPFPPPARVAALLQANFFESAGQIQAFDKYRDVKAAFDRFLASGANQWIRVGW